MLRNAEDAQDIVHGLFVDLMKTPDREVDLPYLYRAVTNRCLTYMRDQGNRRRLLEAYASVAEGMVCRAEEQWIDADMATRLFERLDEESCQLVVFRFFDDMSLEEICEVMNLSRKTVSKRLDRVREHVEALRPGATPTAGPS
jgi:RNA polymerase sigma factor (sigma-70 family)